MSNRAYELMAQLAPMNPRFQAVAASVSSHCCFAYTVVDTARPSVWHDGTVDYAIVCESFDEGDAGAIVNALNANPPPMPPDPRPPTRT